MYHSVLTCLLDISKFTLCSLGFLFSNFGRMICRSLVVVVDLEFCFLGAAIVFVLNRSSSETLTGPMT